ncbi:MAG: NUDIX domain-containing protein [Candidatus Pacearchaeota archaeon]
MEQKTKAPFDVILLGVVFDPEKRKILIVKRGEKDSDIPGLTWQFPEGRLRHGDDVDKVLKNKVKQKTGFEVKNLGSIFYKTYPEKPDLLGAYFLCEVVGGEEKVADDFIELKWVSPDEIEGYFQTSFDSRLKEYLINLK